MPPFLARWPEDWKPKTHKLAEVGRAEQPNGDPGSQGGPVRVPSPWGAQVELPYGARSTPMQPWPAVAGMAWVRPDPASTQGGPLWSAAPGAPGTMWQPLDPRQGRQSAFVDKLQDYGGRQVRRSLDIDWVKVAHSVTKDIFLQESQRNALHTVESPANPLSYGKAREYILLKYGHVPEGRAEEAFGSTLADYICMEISVRAATCREDAHYKAIGNGLHPGRLRGAPPR